MTPWTDLDLWKLAELIKTGKSATEVGKLLGRGRETVRTIARTHNLGQFHAKPGVASAPMPADFAERAPHMTYAELQAHYGISKDAVRKFLRQSGISKKALPRLRPESKPKRTTQSRSDRHFTPQDHYQRDTSEIGLAVEYLRRFSSVIRCDERGRYNERGKFYRRGSTVLTGSEILERAAANKRRERR